MPHIIIEHSSNISSKSINNFLPQIQKEMSLIAEGNFNLEACKARSIEFENYFVGSQNEKSSAFFHITIKILAGRSTQIKTILAEKISAIAQNFLHEQNLKSARTDLSVDIVDMEREIYQKITL